MVPKVVSIVTIGMIGSLSIYSACSIASIVASGILFICALLYHYPYICSMLLHLMLLVVYCI